MIVMFVYDDEKIERKYVDSWIAEVFIFKSLLTFTY